MNTPDTFDMLFGPGGVAQTGLQFYQSTLNNNLAEYQVSHGQVPTQNSSVGNLFTTGAGGNWLVIIFVVIVLVMVFKAIAK